LTDGVRAMLELPAGTVYVKTPHGSDEIATRRHGLGLRVRQLLILIDGRRSVADLARMVSEAELRAHLPLLRDQGFVVVAGAMAAGTAPAGGAAAAGGIGFVARAGVPIGGLPIGMPAPAPDQAAPAALPQRRDLETVRRLLVRQLVDAIGPNADDMAVRIERCRSVDEIRLLLPTISSLVEAIRGRAAMVAFVQHIGPL